MRSVEQWKEWIRPILECLLAIVLIVIMTRIVNLETIHIWVTQAGIWAPMVFFAVIVISQIAAPISGGSIMTLGALALGIPMTLAISYAAILVGCSCNFWISRKMGRRIVKKLLGVYVTKKVDHLLAHNATLNWVLITGTMVFSPDFAGYLIGLTQMSYLKFLGTLAVSACVTISFYVFLGSGLAEFLIRR